MTKTQLIGHLSGQMPSLTKRQVEIVVNTIFTSMLAALARGEKIEIRGFGSFRLRARRMKEGRNPKTGETVHVPAKKVPFFKVGKELKHMLNESAFRQPPDTLAPHDPHMRPFSFTR